ncbi:MAG: sugar phosphate isomerase/epimerase [Bacteroidota bacterium]
MLPVLLTDTVSTDLDRALHYALLWGHEGLVLRTMGRHGERVPTVNEAKLRRRLEEHEMPLVAVEPGLFEGAAADRTQGFTDLGELAEVAAFCERFACHVVLIGALAADPAADPTAGADLLRRAGAAAQRHGLTLAVRNAAGTGCASGQALARLLAAVDHPHVQAAWSPIEALRVDADPMAGVQGLAGRVALTVVRDGQAEAAGWTETTPGDGAVDWNAHLAALRASGFDGPLCLEVHGEPVGPFGLRATTALVRLVRAQRRAERSA